MLSLPQPDTQILSKQGTLEPREVLSSPWFLKCFNDENFNNKSVIEDSEDNTEDESVLADAPGEKAGLWPGGAGACFMNTEQVTHYYRKAAGNQRIYMLCSLSQ